MTYKVMVMKSWSGDIHYFLVTNQPDNWRKDAKWPSVAEFPIGTGYSEDDQRRRAYEYCDYMNKTIPVKPAIGA